MIELGVKGFILKSSGITEVEQAILDVMNGKTYFSNTLPSNSPNKINLRKPQESRAESIIPIPWW